MNTTRDQIIQATRSLVEKQGYHATGMNEILRLSGAPKGSLYYYFPDGKEELAQEAISQTTKEVVGRIRANLALFDDPVEAIQVFVSRIADHIELSQFSSGGPLTAVAMETATSSERLNRACREAFAAIQCAFAEKLAANGYAPESAAQLALFITAAIEGGTLLSRTAHSGDPLRRVAEVLALALRSARP